MQGKKSFVLYCDLIHTIESLEDDEAGKLFKHLLRYVNDENPEPPDRITQLTFEPIKHQLKRDLGKWNDTRGERSKAGHEGGIKSGETRRKQKEANEAIASKRSKPNQTKPNEAVTVNVNANGSVNGTVNETVTDIKERDKLFINELSIFLNQYGRDMLNSFYDYWSEPNKSGKKMRWEMERTWDLNKRLKRWSENKNNFRNGTQQLTSDEKLADFLRTSKFAQK